MKRANPMVHALLILVAVVAIVAIVGCASTRTQESTGQYFDDSTITAKVKTAILQDPALKVFQVNVETFKGAVQLSGFVDSAQAAQQAAVVASQVGGVKSVTNNLLVR